MSSALNQDLSPQTIISHIAIAYYHVRIGPTHTDFEKNLLNEQRQHFLMDILVISIWHTGREKNCAVEQSCISIN